MIFSIFSVFSPCFFGSTLWHPLQLRLVFLAQEPHADCAAIWSLAIKDSAGANSVHHCCPSRGGVGASSQKTSDGWKKDATCMLFFFTYL